MTSIWVLPVMAAALLPQVAAQRTPSAPLIDGRLDDAAWALATGSESFVQRFPDERQPPTERTVVRVLYDADALYVGVVCEHRHTSIFHRLTRRDRELNDADLVAITIGSRGDKSSAFRFAVNAAGVLSDGLYFDDTSYDSSWDENWEAATSTSAEGWTAEFRIPLRVLRFDAVRVQSWGFNVERTLAARQETDVWTYIPRSEGGYVSRLGHLDNLVELPPSHHLLELRPFVVASLGHQSAGFGLRRGSSSPASASQSWRRDDGSSVGMASAVGLDARLHLTADLTLDAALNPDFAQVEADQLILNLSTVETFYPEKRPFFLEGLDTFSTPYNVLYTRRIGAVPGSPGLLMGETAQEAPGPSPIPAALKLVGRVGPVQVGLLSALTSTNTIATSDARGVDLRRLADPPTLFNVLRLRTPVPGGHMGLISSATLRLERPEYGGTTATGALSCAGSTSAQVGEDCFRDAYVGGVDGRWQSPGANYVVQAQTVTSWAAGGQPRRQRDGTVIDPGDVGAGTNLALSKQGGSHWVWWFNGHHNSRKLQLNDAGYLARQNEIGGNLDLHYITLQPWRATLETDTRLGLRHWRNLDNLQLASYAVLQTWARFRNKWQGWTLIQQRAAYFDDREVGDGTALQRASLRGWELGITGDARQPIRPNLIYRLWSLRNGWYTDLAGNLVFRAHPQLDLELLPQISFTRGEPRFVEEQSGGRLLFGNLNALEIGATVRTTFTFTPRLSLQGYGQIFLARGRYTRFSEFQRTPGSRPAVQLEDLTPSAAVPNVDPNFQRAAFNASVVLRWEFRLGSTLYLVYTRSQNPDVKLDPGERPRLDPGALPRAPAANVFLLKASYWWG